MTLGSCRIVTKGPRAGKQQQVARALETDPCLVLMSCLLLVERFLYHARQLGSSMLSYRDGGPGPVSQDVSGIEGLWVRWLLSSGLRYDKAPGFHKSHGKSGAQHRVPCEGEAFREPSEGILPALLCFKNTSLVLLCCAVLHSPCPPCPGGFRRPSWPFARGSPNLVGTANADPNSDMPHCKDPLNCSDLLNQFSCFWSLSSEWQLFGDHSAAACSPHLPLPF